MVERRKGRRPTYPDDLPLTQREIAERVGLTQPQVSRLLRGGRAYISLADVGALAAALGMSADAVVARTPRRAHRP